MRNMVYRIMCWLLGKLCTAYRELFANSSWRPSATRTCWRRVDGTYQGVCCQGKCWPIDYGQKTCCFGLDTCWKCLAFRWWISFARHGPSCSGLGGCTWNWVVWAPGSRCFTRGTIFHHNLQKDTFSSSPCFKVMCSASGTLLGDTTSFLIEWWCCWRHL